MSAALDQQGQPTAAALGFARSCGVDFVDLSRHQDKRGERLYFQQTIPSRNTMELLPQILTQAVQSLDLAQKMYWGEHKQAFVRPVCWLLALFGEEIIPLSLFDRTADRLTYGHRFHSNRALSLASPDQYLTELRANQVMADAEERQDVIRRQAEQQAKEIAGEKSARLMMSAALLAEVTYLVEWPVVLSGRFDPQFLQVPQEALISAMVKNQKYFYLVDQDNKLLPFFITVSNIASRDPEQVSLGNQRVLHPRLADAEFFYQTDQKHGLAEFTKELKQLIFIKGLGSVYDKTLRMENLAVRIAQQMAEQKITNMPVDLDALKRAAHLAKSDLLTSMVQEFPDLQGIMGAYYAAAQDEASQVSQAIREHYLPRFAEDELPKSTEGLALSIADKLDSLVGLCIVNKMPTGDKDPFALRRGAIGILRMILTKKLKLNLSELINSSLADYQQRITIQFNPQDILAKLLDFFYQRLKAYYKEQASNTETKVMGLFSALNSALIEKPLDFHQRIIALQDFMQNSEAATLMAAAKRIHNILSKQNKKGQLNFLTTDFKPELADHAAETELYQQLVLTDKEVIELLSIEDTNYQSIAYKLAALAPVIDGFFEHVMVIHEDVDIRNNRLTLLAKVPEL